MAKTTTRHAPPEIPAGRRPEEFLRDEDLVGYHERRLAAALEADPDGDHAELRRAHRSARKAAALTAEAVAEAEAAALRELEEGDPA